jgi:hypothetical protein
MVSEAQKQLKDYAEYEASKMEVDLSIDELWEIRDEVIRDNFNRVPFPMERPWHCRENVRVLLTALASRKVELERKEGLRQYIEKNEVELLERWMKQGENVVFLDAPRFVTHRMVMKALRPRLLKVLRGEHPDLRIAA